MHDPTERWEELTSDDLSSDNIRNILSNIKDDLWVAAACADRLVEKPDVQRLLLETGLERTNSAVERSKDASFFPSNDLEGSSKDNPLVAHFRAVPIDAELCHLRSVFLTRLDRLVVYDEMLQALSEDGTNVESDFEDEEDWEDDPWGNSESKAPSKAVVLPFSLSTALTGGLFEHASVLASHSLFKPLEILWKHYSEVLWPLRLRILESIPDHSDPLQFAFILPSLDFTSSVEIRVSSSSFREEQDWVESTQVTDALRASSLPTWIPHPPVVVYDLKQAPHERPLNSAELEEWYKKRVDDTINSSGMIDVALSLVQHGASHGIPGLDSLGEELSLLSRLVYDVSKDDEAEDSDDWTLDKWYSLQPSDVVAAYLSHSTSDTLQSDVQRLVMPYLFVLESRAERAGTPDPGLPQRLLYEFVLNAPLSRVADIFECSKPTLSQSKRILRNDEDMARLALACLYGNTSLDEWPTMSRVFECLPAWDIEREGDQEDAMDMTVASLGEFVAPTTSRTTSSPTDLLIFFNPLPLASLSRALDILDVHLESGEILSRWGVPAPLSWFLRSNSNGSEQRAWANRMARQAGGSENHINSQDEWEWLLGDMLKLGGKSENGLKGAFGLIPRDEIKQIFFSGLLSTGAFDIARTMLSRPHSSLKLTPDAVEELVLTCSRELYDNASSGNYRFGEMKLAYDCLDVAKPSPAIQKEKDFIEATSRLSSFNIMSRPGIPISPIEIRLTKDRLSLVSRVLSSNDDAYRHTEVILDLVRKLGFQNDLVAEVKALAMIADTALQVEDFGCACENGLRMVDTVAKLRDSKSLGENDPEIQEANLVCWVSCFQLGRQSEFEDVDRKMYFLGKALEICPPDKIHDVLSPWKKLEDVALQQPHSAAERLRRSASWRAARERPSSVLPGTTSLRARLQQFHMPSPPLLNTPDAAALASKTFRSVTANFPSFRSSTHSTDGGDSAHSFPRSEDVSVHASRAFSKGIGWLIGADEGN